VTDGAGKLPSRRVLHHYYDGYSLADGCCERTGFVSTGAAASTSEGGRRLKGSWCETRRSIATESWPGRWSTLAKYLGRPTPQILLSSYSNAQSARAR